MKVKAVREHQNHFGNNFSKLKGEVYLHPRPAADIGAKLVEKADEKSPLTAKRTKRRGPVQVRKAESTNSKTPTKPNNSIADKPA